MVSVDWSTVFTICVECRLGYNRYHLCRVSTGIQPLQFVSSIDWGTTVAIFVEYRLGVQPLPLVSSIDWGTTATMCVECRQGYNRYHLCRISTVTVISILLNLYLDLY